MTGEEVKEVRLSHACYATIYSVNLSAHYLEAELREYTGETRGALGWSDSIRLQHVEGKLRQLRNVIDRARAQLVQRDQLEQAQREAHEQDCEERARKQVRDAMVRREYLLRKKAEDILKKGWYEGPLKAWGVKLSDPVSKPSKHKKVKPTKSVESTSYF